MGPETSLASRSRTALFFEAWPPLVLAALVWIFAMLAIAALADVVTPYGMTTMDLRARLAPPVLFGGTTRHLLGSDELGRDVLSRLVFSIRMSLLIAFFGTLIAASLGTLLGLVAAHFRGWIEDLVMMLTDFQASMPFLIIALAVLAFFGNSLPLFIALMGFHGWERYARISRGLAIAANEQGYASAVRQLGAPAWRIYGRHILPNIASTLIVSMTLAFPETILLESGLSFLGLGVQPPMPSWGLMISEGKAMMMFKPWVIMIPGAALFALILAVSLIGDGLRDVASGESRT